MKKDDIYLRFYLSLAINQIKNETNTALEAQSIKDFVATIKMRRIANTKTQNKKTISKTLSQMEENENSL